MRASVFRNNNENIVVHRVGSSRTWRDRRLERVSRVGQRLRREEIKISMRARKTWNH